MQREKNRQGRAALVAAALTVCGAAGLALAQESRFTIGDILGTAGNKAVGDSRRDVDRARQRAAEATRKRHEDEGRVQQASLAGLLGARGGGAAETPVRTPKSPKTLPAGGPPLQTYVATLVNPKGVPLPGLSLVASVHRRGTNGRLVPATTPVRLTSDGLGRIRLARLGPLPVVVNLALDPKAAVSSGAWRFADARSVSLPISRPMGARVVDLGRAPYQVAGLGNGWAGGGAAQHSSDSRRTIVYEYRRPDPIVLERDAVDLEIVGAPPGSRVTTAALGEQTLEVPASGRLACRLPRAPLDNGAVPIRVARDLPGGEAEAIVRTYPADPYARNEVLSPALHLVRLTGWRAAGNVNVMDTQAVLVRALGETGRAVVRLPDGAAWWQYGSRGVWVKLRPSPFDKTVLVERVRVVAPGGGDANGVGVGSSVSDLRKALGLPQIEGDGWRAAGDAVRPLEQVDSYLDRGLRVCHAAGRIVWLEVARPAKLLSEGTTAFVPRAPAALFVEGFTNANPNGNGGGELANLVDFRGYLKRLPAVRLVDARDQADLILSGRVSQTTTKAVRPDKTSKTGDNTGPAAVLATELTYSLFDVDKNAFVVKDKAAPAKSLAIMDDLNRATDFSVRVVEIDYAHGLLRLNQGTNAGLWVSPEQPCEFQILIQNAPLPYAAAAGGPQYKAVVVQADPGSAVCELRQIKAGRAGAAPGLAKFEPKPALDMARQIPDPATGVVSARFSLLVPFLRRGE